MCPRLNQECDSLQNHSTGVCVRQPDEPHEFRAVPGQPLPAAAWVSSAPVRRTSLAAGVAPPCSSGQIWRRKLGSRHERFRSWVSPSVARHRLAVRQFAGLERRSISPLSQHYRDTVTVRLPVRPLPSAPERLRGDNHSAPNESARSRARHRTDDACDTLELATSECVLYRPWRRLPPLPPGAERDRRVYGWSRVRPPLVMHRENPLASLNRSSATRSCGIVRSLETPLARSGPLHDARFTRFP